MQGEAIVANYEFPGMLPDDARLFSLFGIRHQYPIFLTSELEALGAAMAEAYVGGVSTLAGYTYFGQLLAHDISHLREEGHNLKVKPIEDDEIRSDISPILDLGCVYDGAVAGSKLRCGNTAYMALGAAITTSGALLQDHDLPRENGEAQIGDFRNDENVIVSQLHLQFLKLHNYFVDAISKDEPQLGVEALFDAARTQVVLHYHEVILNDFLYEILHPDVWTAIIYQGKSILWNPQRGEEPDLPIEFSGAAGRFGHAMVRNEYNLNRTKSVKLRELFLMTGEGGFGSTHKKLPASHVIDWLLFFRFSAEVQRDPRQFLNKARRISPSVDVRLINTGRLSRRDIVNLATRNLMRSNQMGMGTGQEIVRHLTEHFPEQLKVCGIKIQPLTPDQLNLNRNGRPQNILTDHCPTLLERTPLWYYLLAEACIDTDDTTPTDGKFGKLGPLGSLIVAESIKGLLRINKFSLFETKQLSTDIKPSKKIRQVQGRSFLQMSDLILAVNPGLPDPLEPKTR